MKAPGGGFVALNLAVESFADCIGDPVAPPVQQVMQPGLEHPSHLFHWLQLAVDGVEAS